MIDVIFLLLVYFLLSTTHAPPEAQLDPTLRAERVAPGAAADFQPQIVTASIFDGRPGFEIASRRVFTKDALVAILEALPKEGGLFIRGADAAPVSLAAAAIQAATDAGFDRITYVPLDAS